MNDASVDHHEMYVGLGDQQVADQIRDRGGFCKIDVEWLASLPRRREPRERGVESNLNPHFSAPCSGAAES